MSTKSPSPDPMNRESRVGRDALEALRKGARARALVILGWFIGLPIVLLSVAAIPPIRIYVLFFAGGYWLIGIGGIVIALRYQVRQQRRASLLASQHLGIGQNGPLIPARVIRRGNDFIDAWLVGHGIVNPVTGLDPRAVRDGTPSRPIEPFRGRKASTNFGVGLMFFGFALLVPWAILLIRASITDIAPPWFTTLLVVGTFAFIGIGIIVVSVSARRRVRARVAWAQAQQLTQHSSLTE